MRRYPANSWFLLKVNSIASLFFAPFSFKYVLLLFVFHFHAFGITIFVSKYIHRIRHYCIFTVFVVLFSCLVFDKLNKWSENELLILFIILLFDPGPLTSCHLHASCPDCIPSPPPPRSPTPYSPTLLIIQLLIRPGVQLRAPALNLVPRAISSGASCTRVLIFF